jgi:UDP-N-acetylglucosamine 2-epimerase (non-hydrolysing)
LRPVALALAVRGVTPSLIFTGQHPSLHAEDVGLGNFPTARLNCPGQEDPHRHVAAVTAAMLAQLRAPPDLVIVQGDTSSALGAALAAFSTGISVAHVEAGLRTHDPMLPWPEEEYRTAIDADADLLFAPTELAAANLRAEQVPGQIHVTGNTGIDAVLEAAARLPKSGLRNSATPRILVTCHRRESWGHGLASIAQAVTDLSAHGAEVQVLLHPNQFVANSMRALLAGQGGVRLIQPCGHDELLLRMREADVVLSDSGGIQEEAPALGVPLLVLRDKTERPEGIAAGSAILVGTDRNRIVAEARRILADDEVRVRMSRKVFPYGDGRAGERIAGIIEEWLERRSAARRLA